MNYRDWRDAQIAFLQSKLAEALDKNEQLIKKHNGLFDEFERIAPGHVEAIATKKDKDGNVTYTFGEGSDLPSITVMEHSKSVTDNIKVGDVVGFKLLYEKSKE